MPWSKTTLDDRGSQLSSWTVSFVGRVLRLSRLEIEDAYIRRDTALSSYILLMTTLLSLFLAES